MGSKAAWKATSLCAQKKHNNHPKSTADLLVKMASPFYAWLQPSYDSSPENTPVSAGNEQTQILVSSFLQTLALDS